MSENTTSLNEIASHLAVGRVVFAHDDARPLMLMHNDWKAVDLEQYLATPLRIRGTTSFEDLESFIAYVQKFHDQHSVIFDDGRTLKATLDYHAPGQPRHGDHIATFKPKEAFAFTEWKRVCAFSSLSYQDFACFLEDRVSDVQTPDGADLLAMVDSMHVTRTTEAKSVGILKNGARTVTFADTTDTVEIPRQIILAIPLTEDASARVESVRVRVRVGLREGKIAISLSMPDVNDVWSQSWRRVVDRVKSQLPLVAVYR